MTEQTTPLLTFYKGWGNYQQGLIETIEPLSTVQLALPASSHHWTLGMIAQHIVANRVWWFQVWMGEGNPDLAPIANWDPQETEHDLTIDTPELVAGLKSTWQMITDSLARWTATDLSQTFSPPSQMSAEEREMFGELSRQWIIWHVLEHEIHHGGELSLALGGYDLPGVYGDM
jgi:uncharacterized damage-inducible protein DinB